MRRVDSVDGFVFRCCHEWCLLEWIVKIVKHKEVVEVVFSPMFSDWNLIHLGRDRQVRLLKELARSIAAELGFGKSVRIRIRS